MYIQNLRDAFDSLNAKEKEALVLETRNTLISKGSIKKDVRPSEIHRYLENFIQGKETSVKYLEGFLEALEQIKSKEVIKEAFMNGKITESFSWRDIIMTITQDVPSENLLKHTMNQVVLSELKKLFITLAEKCIVNDADTSLRRLMLLNQILETKNK